MARLGVHVLPRAGRDGVDGWRDGRLLVRVTAPPDEGKANAAVCRVLASALDVPKTQVRVAQGAASRRKVVEIDGVTDADLRNAFGEP